ncbi:MAG: hypothetical protein LBH59_05655 [Planctomycetaceae bacterium]|nr:hypothetical protein [Planctomycetaceae bacterium]
MLSFGLFCNQSQQTKAATQQTAQSQSRCKDHNLKGCVLCVAENSSAEMYYELVPHVVLPETIQYNRATPKSNNPATRISTMPTHVATYTAFPSYNLPVNAEFRQINQVAYPITPKVLPLPLPQKNNKKDSNNIRNEKRSVETQVDQKQLENKVDPFSEQPSDYPLSDMLSLKSKKSDANKTYDSSVLDDMFDMSMAILQVSGMEEVVPAVPRFPINDNVLQTGIFCNSTPKPPVAWSFSSPIFKVAAVPAGMGNGYISQFNPHGGVNVGFQPSPNNPMPPQAGMFMPNNFAQNNGANVQQLPNGMLLLSVPPSHSGCGLLRCRDHNWRYMLLPPSPNQIPNLPPQATPTTSNIIDPQTQTLMHPSLQQQQQLAPITAMTPYGMAIVGYRPMLPTPMNYNAGMGNFTNVAYNQFGQPIQQFSPAQLQLAQQQLAQQQLMQQQQLLQQKQFLAAQQTNVDAQAQNTTARDNTEESSDLKTPLTISNEVANNTATGNTTQQDAGQMGLYANPYAMYALQGGNLAGVNPDANSGISAEQAVGSAMTQPNPQFNMTSNPYFSNYPMAVLPQQFGAYGSPYGFNPYSAQIYSTAQLGNQFVPPFNQSYGYMPVGLQQPMPQQQMNQGNGLTMSDVLLLMMLMKENNKPQRRLSFFERIAERRAARRQRAEQNDPFNQIMQMWTTPFYTDSTARMPASNAYPYGYFGAQPSPVNTANYGGYHNLYYGNTTYY